MAKKPNNDEKPKLKRKQYEKELRRLQAELCHLQEWVKAKGRRVIVVFEGRQLRLRSEYILRRGILAASASTQPSIRPQPPSAVP
jgi:Polyphosphate kinase 2 (PPK2)